MSSRAGQLAVPTAIVIAGALVGAGLFLGLREGARPGGAAAVAPAPLVAAAAAALPRLGRGEVTSRVAALLERQRAVLRRRCWDPLERAVASPRPGRWTFQFTVAPGGSQAARGVLEARGTGSAELTRCVLEALPPVKIEPPGASTQVEVPFALP